MDEDELQARDALAAMIFALDLAAIRRVTLGSSNSGTDEMVDDAFDAADRFMRIRKEKHP